MYALLYTTIECVNTLTTKTIYMLNVSICLMYALLYTTIECVNMLTLTTKTIYMLNVSTYFMYALCVHDTIECVYILYVHAYYTNHLYA